MSISESHTHQIARARRYAMLLAAVWTVLVMASATWSLYANYQSALDAARIEARASFDKDLLYRRWASMHGGVYVPVTEETPPNPHLDVPNRDIVTDDGDMLTLVNPAYMTRQVHEIQGRDGARGHITSLDPLRPANAPDDWEHTALMAFEAGETDVSTIERQDDGTYLRYMAAMSVEASCLKCHEHQGYELGDIRGGISVAVPADPYLAARRPLQRGIVIGHGVLWSFGLMGVWLGLQRFVSSTRREYQAEDRLRYSERRYRQMFHKNRAVKLVIHPQTGRILDANAAAVAFYGYSMQQLKDMRIHDINMLDEAGVNHQLELTRREKKTFFEFQHRLASGEVRDVNVFSNVLDTPTGPQFYSVVVDVTDIRRAASQMQFLNRTAVSLLGLTSSESIYTYMGEKLNELLGDNAIILVNLYFPEVHSMKIQGIYGLDDTRLGQVFQMMNYSIVGHTYAEDPTITPLFMRDGLVKYEGGLVEFASNVAPRTLTRQFVRMFSLGDIYLLGLQRDDQLYAGVQLYMRHGQTIENPALYETLVQQVAIAIQRVRAEDRQRQSEARVHAIMSAIPDLMLTNHRDGTLLDYHATDPAMLPVSTNEWVGGHPDDLLPPHLAQLHQRHIVQALDTEQQQSYEYEIEINDALRTFEARTVRAGADETLTMVRDITAQKTAQKREFERALEQERWQLLTNFIQDATHEFRTPLATINTSAYILSRIDDKDKRQAKSDQISGQVHRITRLVDMLLMISRLESPDKLTLQAVNVQELVADICQNKRAEYGDLPQVVLTQADDLPTVRGHGDYLEEAIRQVIDNAYRFTPPAGRVHVSVSGTASHIQCSVRDTGPGIPPEVLPNIFEAFWREDNAHSTPGFGLGLPIARKIIERHGGRLQVESNTDGSLFCIDIPVSAE